jgi:hypothetical protein
MKTKGLATNNITPQLIDINDKTYMQLYTISTKTSNFQGVSNKCKIAHAKIHITCHKRLSGPTSTQERNVPRADILHVCHMDFS